MGTRVLGGGRQSEHEVNLSLPSRGEYCGLINTYKMMKRFM